MDPVTGTCQRLQCTGCEPVNLRHLRHPHSSPCEGDGKAAQAVLLYQVVAVWKDGEVSTCEVPVSRARGGGCGPCHHHHHHHHFNFYLYAKPVSASSLPRLLLSSSQITCRHGDQLFVRSLPRRKPAGGKRQHCARPVSGPRPCDLKVKHTMIVPGRSNITSYNCSLSWRVTAFKDGLSRLLRSSDGLITRVEFDSLTRLPRPWKTPSRTLNN